MATFPGGANTFVKSWDASGKLQVEFSRNPKSFPLNDYVGLRTVKKERGYYLKITAEEAARVVSTDDFVWPDGADAPQTHDNQEEFSWNDFRCDRYAYPYSFGYLATEQQDADFLAIHGRVNAQKAMTLRAIKGLEKLTTAANWGSNTDTATVLSGSGGTWAASSEANQYILKTFLEVALRINKATLGVVRSNHLRCIINPVLAKTIRSNAEIIGFIKQQASAPAMLKGSEFFTKWGLPPELYGIKLVVEDTVRVSTRKNKSSAATPTYCLADTVAIFVAVTQDVDGETVRKPEPGDGVPIFDTLTMFMKEDMTVESKDDPDNRKTNARIVDHFGMEMTAPATGFYVTGCA